MANELNTPFEALHVAAKAIRGVSNISHSSADNDNDSGEIIFTVKGGKTYVLALKEYQE